MKKILFGLLLISILILTGCTQQSTSVSKVVCNKPYILVGTECCLDQNGNSICDSDESSKPSEESANSYTLSDLQADIGNIYFGAEDEFLVLEKDEEIDGVQFFAFNRLKTAKLGQVGREKVFRVLPRKLVIVSIAENEDDYLEAGEPILNFVKEQEDYLTSHVRRNKEVFVNDFTNGSIYTDYVKDLKTGEYISHSSKRTKIIDNTELLETVTQKIVLRNIIYLEEYDILYENKNLPVKPREVKAFGLDYQQSATIFCTPKITISIYFDDVNDEIPLDEISLNNYYNNNLPDIIADAQALINMCEERYEFSFWRGR